MHLVAHDRLVQVPRGLFINLDRSPERLRHMEAELKRFALTGTYERLRAVEAKPGRVGCMCSHVKALEYARRQRGFVHILEDDSILSPRLKPFLRSQELATLMEKYDLLFLDMWVDNSLSAIARYREALRNPGPMDLKGKRVACTSSYIVSPASAARLLKLLTNTPPPIDSRYNDLVQNGSVTAAVMVPFLTGVDIELGSQSRIQSLPAEWVRELIMLRTAFFADQARQPSITFTPTGMPRAAQLVAS